MFSGESIFFFFLPQFLLSVLGPYRHL